MPRRTAAEPKAWYASSITVSSLLVMIVSAFASALVSINLVKLVIHGTPLTVDLQGQLVAALTPVVTLIASSVAFFARILKKDHAPILPAATPGGVRKARARIAAVKRETRESRGIKPLPAP